MALLQKGSSGSKVKELQEALNKSGYNLQVDGIFGDNTLKAVTSYQKANGLGVDGIVGDQTWGKLTGGGSTQTGPTAAPQQTAVTPLGNSYNPQETTGTKADLTAIEGKAPVFTESQTYKDAAEALKQHQSAKPGAYQSTFADRLNSLHEQIMGRGDYESPYAGQIQDALNKYQNTQYESPYGSKIEEIYDKIMNRGDFSYDFNADPLYQQYKDQYIQGGQRAMQDTMADAAALTGGYGNSYASTAGNLAYQQYLTGLNDVIPELQQQAYQRYQDAGSELMNQLSLTQGLDEMAYGRHSDEMGKLLQQIQLMQGMDQDAYGRYQDAGKELYDRLQITQGMDQDAYNKYRDEVGDYYTDLEYLTGAAGDQYNRDYAAYQDALDKYMADRDYYYGKSQDELALELMNSGGSSGRTSFAGGDDDESAGPEYEEPQEGSRITLREYSDALNEIMATTGSVDAVREAAEDIQNRYSITGSDDKKKQALLHAIGSDAEIKKKPASKQSNKFSQTAKK